MCVYIYTHLCYVFFFNILNECYCIPMWLVLYYLFYISLFLVDLMQTCYYFIKSMHFLIFQIYISLKSTFTSYVWKKIEVLYIYIYTCVIYIRVREEKAKKWVSEWVSERESEKRRRKRKRKEKRRRKEETCVCVCICDACTKSITYSSTLNIFGIFPTNGKKSNYIVLEFFFEEYTVIRIFILTHKGNFKDNLIFINKAIIFMCNSFNYSVYKSIK